MVQSEHVRGWVASGLERVAQKTIERTFYLYVDVCSWRQHLHGYVCVWSNCWHGVAPVCSPGNASYIAFPKKKKLNFAGGKKIIEERKHMPTFFTSVFPPLYLPNLPTSCTTKNCPNILYLGMEVVKYKTFCNSNLNCKNVCIFWVRCSRRYQDTHHFCSHGCLWRMWSCGNRMRLDMSITVICSNMIQLFVMPFVSESMTSISWVSPVTKTIAVWKRVS